LAHHLGLFLGLASSEWAAWVQALGTIGAVCGAFAVHVLRSNASRKEQLKSIVAVVRATDEFAETIYTAFRGPGGLALETALIEAHDKIIIAAFVRALNELPLQIVGSAEGVIALLSLRIQVEILGKEIVAFRANAPAADSLTLTGNVTKTVKKIRKDCASLNMALNAP
jgi:hypothetical protein